MPKGAANANAGKIFSPFDNLGLDITIFPNWQDATKKENSNYGSLHN